MSEARARFEKDALPFLSEMFASAMRLTRQRESAEDLVSEVYSRAWKSFAQFTPGTNLRAWLYKILMNTYITHYRQKQRKPQMIALDKPTETENGSEGGDLYARLAEKESSASDNPEAILANRILDKDIKAALEELPEDFRLVVLLCDVQSFSYQDAADVLDIPIGTVRSRLWRGRRLLQKILWNHAVESGVIAGRSEAPRRAG